MKYLALTLPGSTQPIAAPGGIPQGGISGAGSQIVATLITILLLAAIVFALAYLLYGGFKWMTSGGDQEKLAGARQTIIYAVIGLSIAALSFLIIETLGHFFEFKNNILSFPTTS